MKGSSKISWLGLGVIAFGLAVFAVAIPYGISEPSNIRFIVLSPKFWPNIISGVLILIGILMVIQQWASQKFDIVTANKSDDAAEAEERTTPDQWLRLVAIGVVMILFTWATPVIGMVWTSMIGFVALSFIIRTRYRLISLIVAILLPLFLYAFFSHVAGVPIPQGEFVRLP